MKIVFKNNNLIETIDTIPDNTRSKRAEEYMKYLKDHPEAFVESQGIKLSWYQKLILRMLNKKYRR